MKTVEERLEEFCESCDNNCCERKDLELLSFYYVITPEHAKDNVLKTMKCHYLEDGKCMIYHSDIRPNRCRHYPILISLDKVSPVIKLDESCPALTGTDEYPAITWEEFKKSSYYQAALKSWNYHSAISDYF